MNFWKVIIFTLFVFANAKKDTMICNDNGFCKESREVLGVHQAVKK